MKNIINNEAFTNLFIKDGTIKENQYIGQREWSYNLDYYKDEVILYNGDLYKAKTYIPNETEITNTVYWEKLNSYYIKLSNGLIIQWGFEPTGSQQRVVNQKITFPIAFSNTNYSLTVTPNTWQSDTIHRIGWIGSNKLSETQAWINFYGNGNQDTIDGMNWLAIGF